MTARVAVRFLGILGLTHFVFLAAKDGVNYRSPGDAK